MITVPDHVLKGIQAIFASIEEGQSCSVTLHTNGRPTGWSATLEMTRKFEAPSTSSYDVTTRTLVLNGKVRV